MTCDDANVSQMADSIAVLRQAHVHHFRNVLAVIRALVRRSADLDGDQHDRLALLDGRIGAFARAQSAAAGNLALGVDMGVLISEELRVFGLERENGISIAGTTVRCSAGAAGLIALLIHELARLAVETDALAAGGVTIAWTMAEDRFTLICNLTIGSSGFEEETMRWLRDYFEYNFSGTLCHDDGGVVLTLPSNALTSLSPDHL